MSQAIPACTTIPHAGATARPAVIYIPEIQHQRAGASYFAERDARETVRDTVVSDIASGQYEFVLRVIAVDLVLGKCWDASKEIAKAVADQAIDCYGRIPVHCRDFVADHVSVAYLDEVEREAA